MQEAFGALAVGRGAGRNKIAAEVLRTGGKQTARLYGKVVKRMGIDGWPVAWKGGRLLPLWKKKGCRAKCDDHRGLVLQDHCGKAVARSSGS